MLQKNIILIGPMGAGKTTLGKIIADKYQLSFKDCDKEIEQFAGVQIPLIFEYEGEEGFRKRESLVINNLCRQNHLLIATGGGAIVKPANQKVMRSKGIIVFLNASVETQFYRTQKDNNRPLLAGDNPKEKLSQLFKARLPIYQELADITINANGNNVKAVIDDITTQVDAVRS